MATEQIPLARGYRSVIGGLFEDLEFCFPAPFADLLRVAEATFHPDIHSLETGFVAIMSNAKWPIYKVGTEVKSNPIT